MSSELWKDHGQRFGIGLGLALSVLSGLSMLRGEVQRMDALAMLSAALLAAAFLVPAVLYPFAWVLESLFKAVTRALLHLLLVLVFMLVFAPVGIVLRILGKDPLERKIVQDAESYWIERRPRDPERAEKQY